MGRKLAALPRTTLFSLSLAALVLFMAVSAPLMRKVGHDLAESAGISTSAGTDRQIADNGFGERHMDVTGAAYKAFFNLGLSKVNFISHYSERQTVANRNFEFIYWELWVQDDFDFAGALALVKKLVADRVQGVTLAPAQVDAKTYQIALQVDGIETHKVIFSKTGVEAESDAATLALADIDRRVPRIRYRGPARIAIIIDDIGYRQEIERQFFGLPAKVAFAVLPYAPQGVPFAQEAHRRGHEILLHLPMEPKAYPSIKPGRGGLLMSMGVDVLLQTLTEDLARVPHIRGVNNHMGSAFSSDENRMRSVLEIIGDRGLYFVDSRTAGSAVGFEVARSLGIPTAARNVFLDHDPRPDLIAHQFDMLVKVALRKGVAVAIGHPHTATLRTLAAKLPEIRGQNIVVVAPSQIVR